MARSKYRFYGSLELEIDSLRAGGVCQLQPDSARVKGCHAERTGSNLRLEHLAHMNTLPVTLARFDGLSLVKPEPERIMTHAEHSADDDRRVGRSTARDQPRVGLLHSCRGAHPNAPPWPPHSCAYRHAVPHARNHTDTPHDPREVAAGERRGVVGNAPSRAIAEHVPASEPGVLGRSVVMIEPSIRLLPTGPAGKGLTGAMSNMS